VEYDGPATLVQNALVVQAQIRIAVWTDPAGSLQWAGHFVEPAPEFSVQVGPATLRIAGREPAPVTVDYRATRGEEDLGGDFVGHGAPPVLF
jgi:hypothetical protein